jgi:organic radical activating enzyme
LIIKQIKDEDTVNYKKTSMFIGFPTCDFKCERECGKKMCQNSELAKAPDIEISYDAIVDRYMSNDITSAIVFGGLEPFLSPTDMVRLIHCFRQKTDDDIVIYTGYNENEIHIMTYLTQYKNIIIKFGRFIPDQESHLDEVLGVKLASTNQYAKRIS